MDMNVDEWDADDFETEPLVKHKRSRRKVTGRQSVTRLVTGAGDPADPEANFEHPDLKDLARMGFLEALIAGVKTGKEASVYLGRNLDGLVAVKMYTDLRVRSFKRDAAYREGRFIGDARVERAIQHGSRKGLGFRQALWVQEEFRQMQLLREHGVSVPKALAVHGSVLVMEFIGDPDGTPAPRISDLKLEREQAQEALRQSILNLKRIVQAGRVHGDYSAFNILWHRGTAVVIDFPQVMEIKHNPNAQAFLKRDVASLCASFRKQGVQAAEAEVLREVRAT